MCKPNQSFCLEITTYVFTGLLTTSWSACVLTLLLLNVLLLKCVLFPFTDIKVFIYFLIKIGSYDLLFNFDTHVLNISSWQWIKFYMFIGMTWM